VNRWNWRTSSEVKLASFIRSKTAYFFYVEFRPNINTAKLQKTGHTGGSSLKREKVQEGS
jgi:hypothetical protein